MGVYTEEATPSTRTGRVAVRGERGVVPTALAWHPEPRSSLWATPTADCATGPVATRPTRHRRRGRASSAPSPRLGPPTQRASSPATPRAARRVWAVDERHRVSVLVPTHDGRRPRATRRHPRRRPTARRRRGDRRIRRRRRRRTNRDGERHRRRSNGRRGRGRLGRVHTVAADPVVGREATPSEMRGGGAVLRADDRGGSVDEPHRSRRRRPPWCFTATAPVSW